MGQEEKVGSGWSWAAALSSPFKIFLLRIFPIPKIGKGGEKKRKERKKKKRRKGWIY